MSLEETIALIEYLRWQAWPRDKKEDRKFQFLSSMSDRGSFSSYSGPVRCRTAGHPDKGHTWRNVSRSLLRYNDKLRQSMGNWEQVFFYLFFYIFSFYFLFLYLSSLFLYLFLYLLLYLLLFHASFPQTDRLCIFFYLFIVEMLHFIVKGRPFVFECAARAVWAEHESEVLVFEWRSCSLSILCMFCFALNPNQNKDSEKRLEGT